MLLVDDNDRYARAITDDLESRGAEVTRARTAAEGIAALSTGADRFDCIVTDITMEGQLSGLGVLRAAIGRGFRGSLVTASTGLDTRAGYLLNRLFLGMLFRCSYLIPKRIIRRTGAVTWMRVGRGGRRAAGRDA